MRTPRTQSKVFPSVLENEGLSIVVIYSEIRPVLVEKSGVEVDNEAFDVRKKGGRRQI